MHDAYTFIDKKFLVAEHFNVDHYLYCMGLVVKTVYRGRGIATEMLKARTPFIKALGLPVNATICTGKATQKAALAVGFEENYAIGFDELQKNFPTMDFSLADTEQCKIMTLKV